MQMACMSYDLDTSNLTEYNAGPAILVRYKEINLFFK